MVVLSSCSSLEALTSPEFPLLSLCTKTERTCTPCPYQSDLGTSTLVPSAEKVPLSESGEPGLASVSVGVAAREPLGLQTCEFAHASSYLMTDPHNSQANV